MTTPPPYAPPPGWYPDPAGPPAQRWWDGTQWTSATQGATPPWRSIRGLGRAVAILMFLTAVVEAAIALAFQSRRGVIERVFLGDVSFDEVTANDERVALVTGLGFLALLTAGVVWLVWFHAVHANAATLRSVRYRGWAVWGWLVPFANLYIPKQMVNDAWAAGDARHDHEPTPRGISPLVHAWWATWLVGGLVGLVGQVMTLGAEGDAKLEAMQTAATFLAIGAAISTVSAVLAGVLAFRLTDRLERRQSARVTPPSTGTTQPVT